MNAEFAEQKQLHIRWPGDELLCLPAGSVE